MQPHILIDHLASYFKLPDQFLLLLLDFLTNRIQQVLVNGHMSRIRQSNTGSPQGFILSPLLFIMYTDSCRMSHEGSYFVKFSDDTALLTLLQGQDSGHGQALPAFTKWCSDRLLDLNVSKTKELIIDFKNLLNTIVKVCSKITGIQQRNLGTIWEKQAAEKAKIIISQPDHHVDWVFTVALSSSKSNWYAKSFIPSAIKLLNTEPTNFRRV